MPRDMFRDVVDPSITLGTKQWYTVPLSMVTHVAALVALVVVPLVASDILPTPQSVMAFVAAPPPPPTPPPPPPPRDAAPPPPVEVNVNPAAAPIVAPTAITPEPPPRMAAVVGRLQSDIIPIPTVAPGIVPPPPQPTVPVRVGGDIKEPVLITKVSPMYPPVAKAAKIQGTVYIDAIIDKNGNVTNAKPLKALPMLDQAAVDAVMQWRFTPTTLNGQPVEVEMTVTVNFRLQ